ncbi:hypothetical protein POX_e06846 [Penicillium oxalicum]|uniref:Uncharacterized protein n=1 Tax=Penicillium oxalicum (strain 114-2 / CGMCC 5302) TaxID=933388 RepID=S7ZGV8_PENO1|nr:hypothetical protein POX_e06846 [Penicillium oxalicum]EPS27866.1 hypothetical protein PDE_02810 [Penicillium oxalicum 114-2]KAI2788825.1 hypothetical protein POX_e06846 [Penicillium oxalicum]
MQSPIETAWSISTWVCGRMQAFMQVKLVSRPPRMVPPTVRERSEPLGVTTAAKLRSLRELCQIRAEPRLVSDQNLCETFSSHPSRQSWRGLKNEDIIGAGQLHSIFRESTLRAGKSLTAPAVSTGGQISVTKEVTKRLGHLELEF